MSKSNSEERKDLFESRLINHLINRVYSDSSAYDACDQIADELSSRTGKNVRGQVVHFTMKGQSYAKKWFIEALMKWALDTGWMPSDLKDWEHLVWTITGKKQSVQGGDNTAIYKALAELCGKPEVIFETNYRQLLDNSYG